MTTDKTRGGVMEPPQVACPPGDDNNMAEDFGLYPAYALNLKRFVDDYANLAAQQAQAGQKQTDALWAQFLDQNRQWQQIAQQAAINLTQHSQRTAANAQTFDNLVIAGEVDTTAQGSMANNLANQMRSVAFEAVQTAMAQTAQTSAAAQGTTGVAQGALQTQVAPELAQIILNNNTVQTALLAELAKIEQALSVILVKVAGDATEVE